MNGSETGRRKLHLPIATKLMLTFLLVIVLISGVFAVVGVRLIHNRILAEAQEKVRNDLNVAREFYNNNLDHVLDVVQFTAGSFFLQEALEQGQIELALDDLIQVQKWQDLDVLAVTDRYGYVLLRTSAPHISGDNQGNDELVNLVLYSKEALAATTIVPAELLEKESPALAEQAYFEFLDTPFARKRPETEETAGMMLKAVAPVFDAENRLIGTVYGGVLLNRNYTIVDKIKQTVYHDVAYEGEEIGTATIFQDDVRISTNVENEDGSRAIGTRVSEEVYRQVVQEGEAWIGRAYVVNGWYITAYEPIRNIHNQIIGILYVGVHEGKYTSIQRQTVLTFVAISVAGAIIALGVAYFIAQRILVPVNRLVAASQEVASGNLNTKVHLHTNDEFEALAESFNAMASALQRRDEQLKAFATARIRESERLALIGQLSANVAHELNNPLQGIVTYSHLLLEDMGNGEGARDCVERIVGQANRCRDIIRGLLDFARQRPPDKIASDLNAVMRRCVGFVEHQALFHNIKIQEEYQPDLPFVVMDPAQIERVILNLMINAAEAMQGRGRLILATRKAHAADAVEIIVKDTGHGIREEDLEKIFDPFFTTKEVGHGTGLGLAISYGVVRMHGGTIDVTSEVGTGSTFIVRLPLDGNEEKASHESETQAFDH